VLAIGTCVPDGELVLMEKSYVEYLTSCPLPLGCSFSHGLRFLCLLGITVSINTTVVVNPYYGARVFFFLVCGAVFFDCGVAPTLSRPLSRKQQWLERRIVF
jgi:hypothetical protein